jgi:hypothetical protein
LATALVASLVAAPVAGAQTDEAEGDFTVASIDSDQVTDRVGLVDPATGIWHIRGAGGAVNSFFYGNPGDFPIAGDWDCDGISTPGLYRQSDGFVYLRNSNSEGVADIRFFFGNPGDIPLAGDFNGDGCDTISIYRAPEARIYVINKLGANDGGLGAADFNYVFGNPGDKPFVGDFDGDGIDTVGLHRESTGFVYFRNSHTQGNANAEFFFGDPGDRLVAGDWGVVDNTDTPAVFRPSLSRFYFRYTNTQGNANEEIQMGTSAMLPVAGSWTVNLGLAGVLPKAVVGIPYASSLKVVGGIPPFTITKTSGPAWVSVNNSGRFSGTPTAVGNFNIGLTVTDSKGKSINQVVPIAVQNGCDANNQIPNAECVALVALYHSTKGNAWTNRTNWLSSPPCSWFGVTCAGGHVTEVILEGNGLTGIITPLVGNLKSLIELNLQHNLIGGNIPTTLGGVPTLRILDLTRNNIGGPVPVFPAPSNMVEMDLAENNLTGGIPGEIGNETTLVSIDLEENPLGGEIPPELGDLINLQILDLDAAGLTGEIPTEIGNLINLRELGLTENQLSGQIPASLGSPDKPFILEMNLSSNQLTGDIPATIVNLNTLEVPGGFRICSNPGITINGLTTAQPGDPVYDFVFLRDPAWNISCT